MTYMTYRCGKCGFIFGRINEVKRCPVCGSGAVQPSNAEEDACFHQQLEGGSLREGAERGKKRDPCVSRKV